MQYQHTIKRSVSLVGIGLHSGQRSTLHLHPAPIDTGLVFIRHKGNKLETCQASIRNLKPMELCTAIASNGFHIQTTEHLLAALWGMEIDNVYIELDSEEVPVMDGSAAPFVRLLHTAGRLRQSRPRTYLKIVKPLTVGDHTRKLSIVPSPVPKITYSIQYDHWLVQHQVYHHEWSLVTFQRDIAEARTFAFSHEIEALWARGLGQGGSLDNTIVFSETGVLNKDGLRFPDECVRHKILDLIGDLALLGIPIVGHVIADRSGHTLHTELVKAILDNPDTWTLVGIRKNGVSPPLATPSPVPFPSIVS
ncbi:MAG: UDP-3-O-acyl-N-acetylglucosamine deacetylase [Nitrospirae bacterium]|nr:MAG: UDP-3-O-acyl-N-acetylglucosamine deacetylase [Nitrospirota bacterium]